MARRITLVLLPLLLLAGACSSDDGDPGQDALGDVDLVAALTPFDSCDALLEHLRSEAVERVGPYGLDGAGGPVIMEDGFATTEDMAAAETAGAGEATAAPSEAPASTVATSGTNNQESGVDEADTVKLDAERLLVVDDNRLRVVDLTGDAPVARGSVELAGWGHQILVAGDRVLAIGGADEVFPVDPAATTWAPYGSGRVTLTEIDVSDPDAPTVEHTLTVDGAQLSARRIGDTARVVVSAVHPTFPFVYPSDDSPAARRIAEEANRRLIEESTLEDWLPAADLDGEAVDLFACESVEQPSEFSGFGFLSVLTVDLTQPLGTPAATTVVADGQTVYASAESLYVTTSRPQEPEAADLPMPGADIAPPEPEAYETAIHRFDITGTGPATWIASGTVPGHLLNQFSMSEHEGHLRVATTEGAPWGATEQSASRVAVLDTDGQALVEVGAVEDLGVTEQIYAVRFLGDTGYVVTFRQTDPLYVVDLSEPTAPTLEGELHIPGYSAYLHPVADGRLLGIGQDATDQGMTLGLQASLFDVSDPTAPTRLSQVTFPNQYSAAEYDHHAFLWWPTTGQAVLPLTYQDTVVLSVTPDAVTEQGRITLPGGQEVRRNLVHGDTLLTVGADTLVTSDLTTLQPVSEIPL